MTRTGNTPRQPAGGAPTAGATAIAAEASAIAEGLGPLLLEAHRLAASASTGLHGRRRAGPGESYWQHRAYGFGDPVSSIDWRQSARTGDRLYVRQNEWEAAATAWLWRDGSASMDYASRAGLPTKRARADILTAALAVMLAAGGERIGLVGGRPAPYHGRTAPALFLEALLSLPVPAATAPQPIDVRPGASVIYVSDFFLGEAQIADAAVACAAAGADGLFVQVIDPAEEEFPFAGRTLFRDVESSAERTFGDAGAVRADYLAAFAAHRERFSALASGCGWRFISHRTDEPPTAALFAVADALGQGSRR